jgi:hypothetical protein
MLELPMNRMPPSLRRMLAIRGLERCDVLLPLCGAGGAVIGPDRRECEEDEWEKAGQLHQRECRGLASGGNPRKASTEADKDSRFFEQ